MLTGKSTKKSLTGVLMAGAAMALVAWGGSVAYADGVYVYNNATIPPAGIGTGALNQILADDLHMISGGELAAIELGYFSFVEPAGTVTISFFVNDPNDTLSPSEGAPLITSFDVALSGGTGFVGVEHIDDVPPVTLPADVWMGVTFFVPAAGLMVTDPPILLGSSHNLTDSTPGGRHSFGPPGPPYNLSVAVLVVPEPASLGLFSLGALTMLRRRR